jgi:HD-GYP domain-containing protein (c-di-GMP phosphodiesterase class II)
MSTSEEAWVLQTAELVVGSTLSFDLNDSEGLVLHKAGTPISARLIERLQKKNVHSVTVKGRAAQAIDQDAILLSHFDSAIVAEMTQIVSESETALQKFAEGLRQGQSGNVVELERNVNRFVEQAILDSSAAFAVLGRRTKSVSPEIAAKVASRSTLIALTGVTTSVVMARTDADCIEIGMAGLLHDSSLLLHPEWFDETGGLNGNTKLLAEFQRHPIESAEAIEGTDGISDQVLAIISQVHEQCDGSGYPNGLMASEIHQSAKILNTADAYLNLVQPFFNNHRYPPADALAYLCHNAIAGRFDSQVIRGFIMGMSIYPIGSIVELDDESIAMVVRSNIGKPMEPFVQLLNEKAKPIDLSKSNRTIVCPNLKEDPSVRRITKSMMDEILWHSDLGLEPAFS